MIHDTITPDAGLFPGVKGHVSLQLTDTLTGKTEVIEKDNYVATRYFAGMNKALQLNFGEFHGNTSAELVDARINRYARANGDGPTQDMYPSTVPFAGLLLTNHGGAVNVNERQPRGKACGVSHKNFISSVTNCGTYNAAESVHTENFHRFVYDFTTSQGNGTIQSIYTGDFKGSNILNRFEYEPTKATRLVDTSNINLAVSVLNPTSKNLLAMARIASVNSGGNTTLYKLPLRSPVTLGSTAGTVSLAIPAAWGGVLDFTSNGNDVWFLCSMINGANSTRTQAVYKATWADIETHMALGTLAALPYTTAFTFDHTWLNAIGFTALNATSHRSTLGGLTYLPQANTILLTSLGTGGGATAGAWEINATTGAVVTTFSNFAPHIRNGIVTATAGVGDSVWVGGYLRELNRAAQDLDLTMCLASSTANSGSYNNVDGSNIVLVGSDLAYYFGAHASGVNGLVSLIPQQVFFSRVRLDAPVEKTSTQTMKVIYEFTITPVDLFA